MKRASLDARLLAFALALAACDTTSDVVIGRGAGGGHDLPPGKVFDEGRDLPDTGGASAAGANTGAGGALAFPVASGGGQGGCTGIVQVEELIASDVHVVFDQSSSMNVPLPAPASGTFWQAGQAAFARFVSDPQLIGYGVGLQFFPLGGAAPASCTADYSAPAVAVAALPANASPLLAAMQGRTPTGATPLGPALAGAIAHMTQTRSGWSSVLLVTSALPSECEPRDLAAVAAIARGGFQSGLGVRTYVVGLNLGAAGESLHAVAEAGGTDRATLIDAGGDVAGDLYEAMRSVLRRPNLCRWRVPSPPQGHAGPSTDRMSVYFRLADSGTEQVISHVDSPAQCRGDGAPGWYLESGGEAGAEVVLCPRSCAETRTAYDVNIVFGCGPGSGPYQ